MVNDSWLIVFRALKMASVGLRTGPRTGLILRNSFQARTLSVSVLTETRSRHFHSRQINEDAPKVLITGESSIGWCNGPSGPSGSRGSYGYNIPTMLQFCISIVEWDTPLEISLFRDTNATMIFQS